MKVTFVSFLIIFLYLKKLFQFHLYKLFIINKNAEEAATQRSQGRAEGQDGEAVRGELRDADRGQRVLREGPGELLHVENKGGRQAEQPAGRQGGGRREGPQDRDQERRAPLQALRQVPHQEVPQEERTPRLPPRRRQLQEWLRSQVLQHPERRGRRR